MAASWPVGISSGIVTVGNDETGGREMIPGQTLLVVTFLMTAVVILADALATD
jgi:hypothetical protein